MANYTMSHTGEELDIVIDKVLDLEQIQGQAEDKIMSQKAITDNLALKVDKTAIVQVTGTSETDIMSQDAVTDNLALKVDKTAVVQVTGISTTDVMSQNAVTTAINAIDIPEVVQQTGTSIETVMSQNAVTNAIGDIPQTPIVQVTGQSTTDVMSQKATTDSILNPDIASGSRVRINSTKPISSGAVAVTIIDCDSTSSEVGTGSVIVGGDIGNGATYSTSVGYGSTVYAMFGTAVGANALSVASQSTAFGQGAEANGAASCAVGSRAKCTSGTTCNTAVGVGATAQHDYAVALGVLSATTEANAVSVGDGTSNATYGHRKIVNVKDPDNAQDVATKNYVDGKVEDSITDGHTTIAPSGNAVFDALALKLDKTSTGTTRRVYGVDATDAQELTEIETAPTDASTKLVTSGGIKTAIDGKLDVTSSGDLRRVYGVNASNAQELTEIETAPTDSSTKLVTSGGVKSALDAKVEDAITDGHTTIAPSGNAVYDALALKAPLASPAFTGIPTGIRQDFTATLPYASWTGSSAPYTKEVTVVGILSTDKPDINLDLSSSAYSDVATIQSDWANVYRGVTSADTITFYASTVPTIDIPLEIKVVR